MQELAVKIIAMPSDCNPDGDIFGGWIISMMDLAGGTLARRIARGRIVTVAMDRVEFHLPVHVGDHVECCVELLKTGNTSMTIKVVAHVERRISGEKEKVTEGVFTYVAIGDDRRPRKILKS